jgi:hypothetical protein
MTQAHQVDFLVSGVIDSSGNPLSGGSIYFYEADGLTLKTVWEDADKVTESENPVTLDARGVAAIYADGTYSIVIKDSDGVIIDTKDLHTYQIISLSTLYINASDYGTDKNDTTIGLAIAATAGNDRTIYLSPGNWEIDNDLTIPSNVNLKYEFGAYTTVASAKTLTITGVIEAQNYYIFRGSGTTTFSGSRQSYFLVDWFASSKIGVAYSYSSTTDVDVTGLTKTHTIMNIQGLSGNIEVTSNPQIVAGTVNGEFLIVRGRSDSATVTFSNGNGLVLLSGQPITLGKNCVISFIWNSTDSVWEEISRSATV